MDRIVVAFGNEEGRNRIMQSLAASGIHVKHCATSGAEVKRILNKSGGGIVICGSRLPDMRAEDLLRDLEGRALMLLVAKPGQGLPWERENVFHLPLPASGPELAATVRILLQIEERRPHLSAAHRSQADEAAIGQAKSLLMRREGYTEEEAHRLIQRRSMDRGVKMAETAREILGS